MKNEESACYYDGAFASHMANFIRFKRAQGLKYTTVPRSLRRFSRFLAANASDETSISKDLIEEWCSQGLNEHPSTQKLRIIETTQFLKYLADNGVAVSLPRTKQKFHADEVFIPYIFSDAELHRFFESCDQVRARTPSVMPTLLPVLFRLLLGCGLRISEALGLQLRDVDLENGLITVRMSKLDKERLIPLSNSMLLVLCSYSATSHKIPKSGDTLYFTHRDGRKIHKESIYRWFRKVLWSAGISHGGRGNGPRVHDFRHTFSVYSLKAMVGKGMDMYCALPLLSTYLGHASVSATSQYVRLTQDMFPEIVEKASAIAAFVIPRGNLS
jgi:integrase